MGSDYSQKRLQRRRERRQQISSIQIIFVSIISIGLLLAINFSARIRQGQLTEEVRGKIEATITILEAQQIDLRQQRDFAASDASVEQWAHREGKYVRAGEVLVVPVPGVQPILTLQPTPTPQPLQTPEPEVPIWQLWWRLFFDSDPPD